MREEKRYLSSINTSFQNQSNYQVVDTNESYQDHDNYRLKLNLKENEDITIDGPVTPSFASSFPLIGVDNSSDNLSVKDFETSQGTKPENYSSLEIFQDKNNRRKQLSKTDNSREDYFISNENSPTASNRDFTKYLSPQITKFDEHMCMIMDSDADTVKDKNTNVMGAWDLYSSSTNKSTVPSYEESFGSNYTSSSSLINQKIDKREDRLNNNEKKVN